MYCIECGAQAQEAAKFCFRCGTRIVGAQPLSQFGQPQSGSAYAASSAEERAVQDVIPPPDTARSDAPPTKISLGEPSPPTERVSELYGVRGWLLLFCIWLTFLAPIGYLNEIGNIGKVILDSQRFGVSTSGSLNFFLWFTVLAYVALCLISFTAGVALWTKSKIGVPSAHLYLRCMLASAWIIGLWGLGLINDDPDMLARLMFQVLWCTVLFFVGESYLLKSARVRATFSA